MPGPARSADAKVVTVALLGCAVMIAQQVAGRAMRDALFLSAYGVHALPPMMVAGAIASVLSVLAISRILARSSPVRVVVLLFAASAMLLCIEWAAALIAPRVAALALFFHLAVFGAPLISAFWSVIDERFESGDTRKALTRIASGAALGGVIGGLTVVVVASHIGVPAMFLVLAAASAASALSIRRLGPARATPRGPSALADAPSALAAMRAFGGGSHLRSICWIVALGGLSSALLDYAISAQAAAAYPAAGPALISFFAVFHLGVALLAFAVQIAFSRASLRRFGLCNTLALLPSAVVIAAVSALVAPQLASVVAARGIEAILRNSVFRSAYELLFIPLADARRRAAKALIDVGFDRLGTVAGALITLAVVAAAPAAGLKLVLGACASAALATLVLSLLLRRGYVTMLELRLRAGDLPLDDNLVDASNELVPLRVGLAFANPAAHAAGPWPPGTVPIEAAADAQPLDEGDMQRTAKLLTSGLEDERFEVRSACGLALAKLMEQNPSIILSARALLSAVERELIDPSGETERVRERRTGEGRARFGKRAVDLSRLRHVFRLLALSLDRPPLVTAFAALRADGDELRGTALEYLEHVLPPSIRDGVWRQVADAARWQGSLEKPRRLTSLGGQPRDTLGCSARPMGLGAGCAGRDL